MCPTAPWPPQSGWSILLLPGAGSGASLSSHQLPCEDLRGKRDPSPFSKGCARVRQLFPSSQGTNNCKTFLFPADRKPSGSSAGVFASRSWGQRPAFPSLLPPQQSQKPLDPNLGNAPHLTRDLISGPVHRPAVPAAGRFLCSLRVCFLRRFFCEFPLPGCCVTSGSLCRSLSKRWSTAQLFLI